MRKEDIEYYVREKLVRPRTPDLNLIKTLISLAEEKAKAAKMLPADVRSSRKP